MDSKKSKRRKKTKQKTAVETKDGAAEVFVLPPELLQKLGINLGEIGSDQECPTNVSSECDASPLNNAPATSVSSTPSEPQKEINQESTILETANLMKTSVFLSPTFVVNGINSSPGNLEISDILEQERVDINNSIGAVDKPKVTNNVPNDIMKNVSDKKVDDLKENSEPNIGKKYAHKPPHYEDDIVSNQETVQLTNNTNIAKRLMSVEDHTDEAYSSDCSNSNLGSTREGFIYIPDKHSVEIPLESSNKINIISEEILNPSQIKELKLLHSPKLSDLIPLSINSVITPFTRKISECADMLKNDVLLDHNNLDNSHLKLNSPLCLESCKSMETLILFDDKGDVIQTDCDGIFDINNSDILFENVSKGQEALNKIIDPAMQTHETNNGVSIDFVESDIDMHLRDNEELLDEIVNEITSNDIEIMSKIERTKEEYVNKSNTNETHLATDDGKPVAFNFDEHGLKNLFTQCDNENDEMHNDWCIGYGSHTNGHNNDKKGNDENRSTQMEINAKNITNTSVNQECKESKNYEIRVQNNSNEKTKSNNIKDSFAPSLCNIKVDKGIQCMDVDSELIKNTGIVNSKVINNQNDSLLNSIKKSNDVNIVMNKTMNDLKKSPEENKADVDRVKEIAMYLAQVAQNHSVGRKLKNKYHKCLKIPNKKVMHNVLTPKLKEGVEKPGGDLPEHNTLPKVSKTYINHKKVTKNIVADIATNSLDTPQTSSYANDAKKSPLTCKEHEINDSVIGESEIRTLEFCLCSDFGRLAYYDLDSVYEHIHFLEHKNNVCNREIIFSIYNEFVDFETRDNDTSCLEQIMEADSSEDDYCICWRNIENKSKKFQKELSSIMLAQEQTIPLSDKSSKDLVTDSVIRKPNDLDINVETYKESLKRVPDAVEIIQRDESNSCQSENVVIGTSISSTENEVDKQVSLENNNASGSKKNKSVKTGNDVTKEEKTNKKKTSRNPDSNDVNIKQQTELKCELKAEKQKTSVQCAVCQAVLSEKEWDDHIANEHCYIAWRSGSSIDLEDPNLKTKLQVKLKAAKVLKCPLCGTKRKSTTLFLSHIEKCMQAKSLSNASTNHSLDDVTMDESTKLGEVVKNSDDLVVKCAVCNEKLKNSEWSDHNAELHNSKAWKDGETLQKRKRSVSREDAEEISKVEPPNKKSVKCEVCKVILAENEWEDHISNEHCYIAWRSGDSINLEDSDLKTKLQRRLKDTNILKCPLCNTERKSLKRFLSHVKKCLDSKKSESSLNISSNDVTMDETKEVEQSTEVKRKRPSRKTAVPDDPSVKCAVCQLGLKDSEWIDHIGVAHNYVAWKDGENPVNVEDQEEVRLHLTAISRKYGDLKCHKCGVNRKYAKTYMQHVRHCIQDVSDSEELNQSEELNVEVQVENSEKKTSEIKCGVCKKVINSDWLDHIEKEHSYLAWKSGDPPLDVDDEEAVKSHLYNILQENGKLVCQKCGLARKYVKPYMTHIETCTGPEEESETEEVNQSGELNDEVNIKHSGIKTNEVRCAVCEKVVNYDWLDHIQKEHSYLAWKTGDRPLDVDDDEAVKSHLYKILQQTGKLICHKCGLARKYVKPYMTHIQRCDGFELSNSFFDKSRSIDGSHVVESSKLVKCGVCGKEVPSNRWIDHIQKDHEYMAWIEGETFDLNDETQVERHLDTIVEEVTSLTCPKCGVVRKSAASYLQHWRSCEVDLKSRNKEGIVMTDQNKLICGVCSEHIDPKKWKVHRMKNHYNVAWAVGLPPVNFRDPNVIDSLLKEYRAWNNKKLVCKICGISRVSCIGFYAHIIACGKSEEEINEHKNTCKICDKKYLYIYESQHMTWHREQEAIKRRLKSLEESEMTDNDKKKSEGGSEVSPGPRRAAQRARNVIEKYKAENQSALTCSVCQFDANTEKELDDHTCVKSERYDSDTDVSVKLENEGNDESEDSEVDSGVSDDEVEESKKRIRKCVPACAKVPRFPFELPNVNSYLNRSGAEFYEFHFTNEDLFPEWQNAVTEEVPVERISDYMPTLEKSCKVNLMSSWDTFKTFEARHIRGQNQCLFVGGSIQSLAWVPPRHGEDAGNQYLAVIVHRGPDSPKIHFEELASGPGLIQIWDFARFDDKKPAKFVLGIAQDYGTPWAMDWCPSGARYMPNESSNSNLRLGLLAAAFSNGSAYIFSVPYPARIVKKDKLVNKLKPVAELRLTTGSDRKIYQATAITWSQQKNHKTVLVGYADGSTAYFDLKSESPFLKTKEDGVTIFYPFHDVRPHNSCVLGVGMYPSTSPDTTSAVCSASTTGAALVSRPCVRPARQQTHMPCADAVFEPHWPTAVVLVNDTGTASMVNELEWWGGGRRFGGPQAAAACIACARMVIAAPPLLRVMTPHPANKDLQKRTLAVIQMASLGKVRKIKNDELQTKVEPFTFDDAVKKYGIELNLEKSVINRASVVREQYPDRFPLADVTSMAFCPAAAHHQKLAVATHAGILFLLIV